MKINMNESEIRKLNFASLANGDVFIQNGILYMKIPLFEKDSYKVNAIRLTEGNHSIFDSFNSNVQKVTGEFVVEKIG